MTPGSELRMPVGERKICPAVVIRGRQVNPFVVIEAVDEVSVVDAVGMLLDKGEDARRIRDL